MIRRWLMRLLQSSIEAQFHQVYDDGLEDGFTVGRRLERQDCINMVEDEFDALSSLGAETDYIMGIEHALLLLKTSEIKK